MGRQRYLQTLRESNQGYNPEPIENFENLKIERDGGGLLYLLNKESNEVETWTKSESASEEEFIERWPRTFAIVYKGRFYYRAA